MADVLRVSIKGSMAGGEEWSVNPVYRIGGDFGTPVSSTQANAIATAIAAIAVPTGLLAMQAVSTTVTGARVEARSLAGLLEAQGEAVKAVPTVGTGTSPAPFQTSAVISLRTALAGASGRGRLYWPATAVTLTGSNLRPTPATMTSFLSGAKTYLSSIQSAIDVTLDGISLCVWSRKLLSTQNVTQLQSGDVMDVQRRRRDQLIETYNSLVWP